MHENENTPTIIDDNENTIEADRDDSWLKLYTPLKRYEESMFEESGIGIIILRKQCNKKANIIQKFKQ